MCDLSEGAQRERELRYEKAYTERLARIEEKLDRVVSFVDELEGTIKQVSKSPFLAPMLGR